MGNICNSEKTRTARLESFCTDIDSPRSPVLIPRQEKLVLLFERESPFSHIPSSSPLFSSLNHPLSKADFGAFLSQFSFSKGQGLYFAALTGEGTEVDRKMLFALVVLLSTDPLQTKVTKFFNAMDFLSSMSSQSLEWALTLLFDLAVHITPKFVTSKGEIFNIKNYQNILKTQKKVFVTKHLQLFMNGRTELTRLEFGLMLETRSLGYLFSPTKLRMKVLEDLTKF